MNNKRLTKFSLAAFALSLLLAACQDQSGATPTPVISAGPTTSAIVPVPATNATSTTAVATLPASSTTAAAPTAVPVTPTPVADPQTNAALDKIRQATQKLAVDSKSFRYRLSQTGQLNSGGSLSAFEAAGSGEFQRPSFHQLLTLKVSGQEQQVEHYSQGSQLYQRVTGLVAWRKWQPAMAGPYPGLTGAGSFAAAGSENLDSLKTTKYTWTFPASQLLPASGQPEGLGALSVTGLYQAFTGDKTSLAQAAIWVDDATGNIARYQVTTTFTSGGAKLDYRATYDYAEFDAANVKVEAPGDLPR